jgi:hypothetical protein
MDYLWERVVASESVLEVEISLISPPEGMTITALSGSNIIISTRSIANIMDELIWSTLAVFIGMFAVLALREGKIALSRLLELDELVDFILGKQAAIVVADVTVTSSTVWTVVYHLSLRRNRSVCLHL